MVLDIKMGTFSKQNCNKETGWILSEEGNKMFKKVTEVHQGRFYQCKDIHEKYNTWEKNMRNAANICFKKRKTTGVTAKIENKGIKHSLRTKLSIIAKKGKIQRNIVSRYIKFINIENDIHLKKIKSAKLSVKLCNLTEKNMLSSDAFWKLKKGTGKTINHLSSILVDGVEVYEEQKIREAFSQEFKQSLRNRAPSEGWSAYVNTTNRLADVVLDKCKAVKVPNFSVKEVHNVINSLKKGKSAGI